MEDCHAPPHAAIELKGERSYHGDSRSVSALRSDGSAREPSTKLAFGRSQILWNPCVSNARLRLAPIALRSSKNSLR